jgi:hypothetical protein
MSFPSEEFLERNFVECLMEIQKSYVNIPKHLRLRTEKWCEKLVSSGGTNRIWKKTRNDYAKLLLGMVCSNHFMEPFHSMPPDGPLAPFPTHLKTKLKESLGPHESAFWRQLYNNISDPTESRSRNLIPESPALNESFTRFSGAISSQKEVQSLVLLTREQEQRIIILEQQLRDERLSHELELQRLAYSHRIDLAKAVGRMSSSGTTNFPTSPLNSSTSKISLPIQASTDVSILRDPEESHTDERLFGAIKPTTSIYDPQLRRSNISEKEFGRGSILAGGDGKYEIRSSAEEDEDFLMYIERFQHDIKKKISTEL